MTPPRILAFAGSLREASFNKRLLAIAAAGAEAAGAQVTRIDLRDYPMPLYDGDLEARSGLPEAALGFRRALGEHDGFLLASPEYNGSISGVLKNAIDWASRPAPAESSPDPFHGKVAAVLSASPGRFGGARGQIVLRTLLATLQVLVLPDLVVVPGANEAFAPDGRLRDEKRHAQVGALGEKLAATLAKLRA